MIDWNHELAMLTLTAAVFCGLYVVGLGFVIWRSYATITDRHARWDLRWKLREEFFLSGWSLRDADARSEDVAYNDGVNTKWLMNT